MARLCLDQNFLLLCHRRSVAVLCVLYKIRCNPIHQLGDVLPGPYVPVRVTRGALVTRRYTHAPPRCRTSQYRRTSVALSVSLWNDLADPVFDGVGLAGFKSRANVFFYLICSIPTAVFYYFSLSLLPVYRLVLWGWHDRVYITLSQPCLPTSFNNSNNNNDITYVSELYMLYNELPSASTRVRHTLAVAAAHPLLFEVSRCRTSEFCKVFPDGPGSNLE